MLTLYEEAFAGLFETTDDPASYSRRCFARRCEAFSFWFATINHYASASLDAKRKDLLMKYLAQKYVPQTMEKRLKNSLIGQIAQIFTAPVE